MGNLESQIGSLLECCEAEPEHERLEEFEELRDDDTDESDDDPLTAEPRPGSGTSSLERRSSPNQSKKESPP